MKLSRIPGHEVTAKVNYSWKASTVEMLQQYAAFYRAQTGVEVPVKDVAEQILRDFMGDDKDFQRFLRSAAPVAPAAPAAQTARADAAE